MTEPTTLQFKTGEELLKAIGKLPAKTSFQAYFNSPNPGDFSLVTNQAVPKRLEEK